MTSVNTFLKVLNKVGYPNRSIHSIAKAINYDIDRFLPDLKNEIGDEGVKDFCDKAIEKLTGEKGLNVSIGGPNNNEYCYIKIYPINYDEDESENDVICNWYWGDSKIFHIDEDGNTGYFTIQEIIDSTDMGNWGDLDEFLDDIRTDAYNIVDSKCGFGIWWT